MKKEKENTEWKEWKEKKESTKRVDWLSLSTRLHFTFHSPSFSLPSFHSSSSSSSPSFLSSSTMGNAFEKELKSLEDRNEIDLSRRQITKASGFNYFLFFQTKLVKPFRDMPNCLMMVMMMSQPHVKRRKKKVD